MYFTKSGKKKKTVPRSLQKLISIRIGAVFLAGAVVLVTVYSFSQFFINLRMYEKRQDDFLKIARQSIQWRLAEADGTIRYLVEQCNLRGIVDEEQLAAAYIMHPYFETLMILDSEGHRLLSEPARDGPGFFSENPVVDSRSPFLFSRVSLPYVYHETGRVTVDFLQKTRAGRCVLGRLDLAFLQEIVLKTLEGQGADRLLIVTDPFGNVLAHPDETMVHERMNIGLAGLPKSGRGFFRLLGRDYYLLHTDIPETGWVLIDATRMLPLFGELGRSVVSIILLLLLFILLLGMYGKKLVNQVVVGPLGSFVEVIRLSSAKDAPMAIETRLSEYREILQLQEAFNSLVRKIEQRDRDLEKFHLVVREAGFAIYITDREGRIEYVNPAFERITGFGEKDAVGRDPGFLNSGEMGKWYFEQLWDTVLNGKIWEGEIINRKKDGTLYYGHQTITPILDKNGLVSNFVVLQSDITDRKHMENELRKARDQAEEASRAKSNFVANISHEIRTPMNVILGYNQLLAESNEDPAVRDYLDSIEKAGNVLLSLINDILDLSRIESGKLTFEYREVDLRRLMRDIGQLFEVKVRQKGLDYFEEISEELPDRLVLDEVRFRQLLMNLIGNAVKFTEEGFVRVRLESSPVPEKKTGVNLLLLVEDSGIGIREDQQQRVFEAFQQQEGQSSRKFGGTGLGLAITKHLVEAMGGKISVESSPGRGTLFRVVLKDVVVSETQGAADAAGNPALQGGPETQRNLEPAGDVRQLEMYNPGDFLMDEAGLIIRLREDFLPRWEKLRHTMFLDELQDFAESLLKLGKAHNAVFLVRYAGDLLQAARQVDIAELELLIQDFQRVLVGSGYLPQASAEQASGVSEPMDRENQSRE